MKMPTPLAKMPSAPIAKESSVTMFASAPASALPMLSDLPLVPPYKILCPHSRRALLIAFATTVTNLDIFPEPAPRRAKIRLKFGSKTQQDLVLIVQEPLPQNALAVRRVFTGPQNADLGQTSMDSPFPQSRETPTGPSPRAPFRV